MKVPLDLCSSVSPTLPMEPPNPSTSMMITDAGSSSRNVWDRKLRLTPLDNNSKAMSSKSTEASIKTDLP